MHLQQLLPNVPSEISDALENELNEIQSRFARRDWGPTELNGGRLGEAILRYLEWKDTGNFTPIGQQLNIMQIVNRVNNNATVPDGLRFHVLKCAEVLLDIRNRRDVAHLGNTVNVNEMDSRLVLRLAAWSLAEIVREETNVTPGEAQDAVDRLSARNISLIEEVGGDTIVVATNLNAINRALVALYQRYPNPIELGDLLRMINYGNKTRLRELLVTQAREGLLHLQQDNVFITTKGTAWVESNIDMNLQID